MFQFVPTAFGPVTGQKSLTSLFWKVNGQVIGKEKKSQGK